MAICPNNTYVVLGSPLSQFNDTYIQAGTTTVNDTVFASYTGQTNGMLLYVHNYASPGSNPQWTLRDAVVNTTAGYNWSDFSDLTQSCPVNFSVSSFTFASTPGAVLIATPESLRSTRQKLYIHSTAQYEGAIWSGEYTLQPDTYNNFSWWKNEATGAVIAGELQVSATPRINWYVFLSKNDADYWLFTPQNLRESTYYVSVGVDITPGSDVLPIVGEQYFAGGATEGSFGSSVVSYKPFQDPLPRQTNFDELTGFFFRPGALYEYNDLDKYGLYTFKGYATHNGSSNDTWRGTSYTWQVGASVASPSNLMFIEWIKSLQVGVDYKIEGKQILLNRNSQKLNSIKAFSGNNFLELVNLNTTVLNLKKVDLQGSKVSNITLGNVSEEVRLNSVVSLDSGSSNIELKGTYAGNFLLGSETSFNNFLVERDDAFKNVTNFQDNGVLYSFSTGTYELLLEKLAESEAIISAKLNDLFADDKIEAITNPGIKEKVTAKKAIAVAKAGSGSGSGGSGGVGLTFLNAIYEEADKIIWDYTRNRHVPIANYYLKTAAVRPLVASNISVFQATTSEIMLAINDIIASLDNSSYSILYGKKFFNFNYQPESSIQINMVRANQGSFVGGFSTFLQFFSKEGPETFSLQSLTNGLTAITYHSGSDLEPIIAPRNPIKIQGVGTLCFEVYDNGQVWAVVTNISPEIRTTTTNADLISWTEDGHSPTVIGNSFVSNYEFTLHQTNVYQGKFYFDHGAGPRFTVSVTSDNKIKIGGTVNQGYPAVPAINIPQDFSKDDIKYAAILLDLSSDGALLVLLNNGDLYYYVVRTGQWIKIATNIKEIVADNQTSTFYILDGKDDEIKQLGANGNLYTSLTFDELPVVSLVAGKKFLKISGSYGIKKFE